MKLLLRFLCLGLVVVAGVSQVRAQAPVISSLSQNGVLTCSGLQPGTTATVEWASSLSGPWYTNWDNLSSITVATNSAITASVPMFYRVRGVPIDTTTNGMTLIPAGSFTMGNSINDSDITDAKPTNVFVSAFYMDINFVSYGQWTNINAYATAHGYSLTNAGAGKNSATNQPVQTVDWFDCVKWCNARSQLAGLVPVYYTDAGLTQIYTNGEVTVYQNLAANGYRLPTEAEWEKAARGGLSGKRFPWGDTISQSQANYLSYGSLSYDLGPGGYNAIGSVGGTSPATSAVGSFAPNGYGLYDMAGNLWQWCWDWYGTPYGQPTTNNPTGAGSGSGTRVLRGGSWGSYAYSSRCAVRGTSNPNAANAYFGFRCVRGL